jgi:hypothetical protein
VVVLHDPSQSVLVIVLREPLGSDQTRCQIATDGIVLAGFRRIQTTSTRRFEGDHVAVAECEPRLRWDHFPVEEISSWATRICPEQPARREPYSFVANGHRNRIVGLAAEHQALSVAAAKSAKPAGIGNERFLLDDDRNLVLERLDRLIGYVARKD